MIVLRCQAGGRLHPLVPWFSYFGFFPFKIEAKRKWSYEEGLNVESSFKHNGEWYFRVMRRISFTHIYNNNNNRPGTSFFCF